MRSPEAPIENNQGSSPEAPRSEDVGSTEIMDLYLTDIRRHPLLTENEEITLAKKIQAGALAKNTLKTDDHHQEQRDRLEELATIGETAQERMILSNTRLVVSVAKQFQGRGVPLPDLIQEGNLGLITATTKFDYHRGKRFGYYALYWIRRDIRNAIADKSRTSRLSRHQHWQLGLFNHKRYQLTQELGREPTEEELSQVTKKSPEKVRELMLWSLNPLSLQSPSRLRDGEEIGDAIPDQNAADPEKAVMENFLKRDLDEALELLPTREATIIRLRFGLNGKEPHTLEDVGKKFDLTKQRIHQVEKEALEFIRLHNFSTKLREA